MRRLFFIQDGRFFRKHRSQLELRFRVWELPVPPEFPTLACWRRRRLHLDDAARHVGPATCDTCGTCRACGISQTCGARGTCGACETCKTCGTCATCATCGTCETSGTCGTCDFTCDSCGACYLQKGQRMRHGKGKLETFFAVKYDGDFDDAAAIIGGSAQASPVRPKILPPRLGTPATSVSTRRREKRAAACPLARRLSARCRR